MIRRLGLVVIPALVALVVVPEPAVALDCIEVAQHKYCIP